MATLVTGAAGFIGFHASMALLDQGERVLGVDNLNTYYDPALKRARLEQLIGRDGFVFRKADIADPEALRAAIDDMDDPIEVVLHLAAQAGVRYSLQAPLAYGDSNLRGHLVVLELCRHHLPALKHLVYASSSSVYGGNTKVPFSEDDRVDQPVSLYAATKRSNELTSHAYAHLYGLPQTGLRFFTVYGSHGRPDMAYYSFSDAITAGRPIKLFNHGEMQRDFTYIDDIVAGILAAIAHPPAGDGAPPHRVFNLGNNRPVQLRRFVEILEREFDRKAQIELAPLPPGDVLCTYADLTRSRETLGYQPKTSIEEGLARFASWYKAFHGRN